MSAQEDLKDQNSEKANGLDRPPDQSLPESALRPDLSGMEKHRGKRQGDTYIRIVRPDPHVLRRVAPGVLEASEEISRPHSGIGHLYVHIKQVLVGRPLATVQEKQERLTKLKALPIFSSDAISSSAYATEEILIVLVTAGAAGLVFAVPIAFGIAILLGDSLVLVPPNRPRLSARRGLVHGFP